MSIESAPIRPLPATYAPHGGRLYRIKSGDNWWSIAKSANVDVWALIEFNFKTRNPNEVNWYMRRNIGCRKATPDGKNYMFAPPMSPGTIYLPPLGGTPAVKLDYTVPGIFNIIAQPSSMACWATVGTMMLSWRDQQSYTIEGAMGICGTKWLNMYTSNTGLPASQHGDFAGDAGMETEPLACHPGESWQNMLKAYGPLAVVTANPFHARIMVAIRGDGTDTGTEVELIDPAGGRRYWINFGTFSQAFEGVHVSPRLQIWHF